MNVTFGEVKRVPIASVLAHYRIDVRRQGFSWPRTVPCRRMPRWIWTR
jgi:hypothetical protein